MYCLAKTKSNEKVEEVTNGAYEHIVERIWRKAEEGETQYNFHFRRIRMVHSKKLLNKAIKIANLLEKKGYFIKIFETGNDYWCELEILINWSGMPEKTYTPFNENDKMLYYTKDVKNRIN